MFGNVDKFCLNVGWSPAGRLFRLRQVEKNSIVGDERDWIILNTIHRSFPFQFYLSSVVISSHHNKLSIVEELKVVISINISAQVSNWTYAQHNHSSDLK